MALRVRKDGRILCAAIHKAEDGDVYIDDELHYRLTVIEKAIVTEPMEKHRLRGEWWWRNQVPEGVEIASFYVRD